jgi:transposase-like protein
MNKVDLWSEAGLVALLARKRRVLERQVICTNCGADQVQVTDYLYVPAKYKCRYCKTRFMNEPLIPAKEGTSR